MDEICEGGFGGGGYAGDVGEETVDGAEEVFLAEESSAYVAGWDIVFDV